MIVFNLGRLQLLGYLQLAFQAVNDLFGLLDALIITGQLVRLERRAVSFDAILNGLNQFSQAACGPRSFGQLSKFCSGGGMK